MKRRGIPPDLRRRCSARGLRAVNAVNRASGALQPRDHQHPVPAATRQPRAGGERRAALRCPQLTFGPGGLQPAAAPKRSRAAPGSPAAGPALPEPRGSPQDPRRRGLPRLCRHTPPPPQPPGPPPQLPSGRAALQRRGRPAPAPAEGPAQTRGSGRCLCGGVGRRSAARFGRRSPGGLPTWRGGGQQGGEEQQGGPGPRRGAGGGGPRHGAGGRGARGRRERRGAGAAARPASVSAGLPRCFLRAPPSPPPGLPGDCSGAAPRRREPALRPPPLHPLRGAPPPRPRPARPPLPAPAPRPGTPAPAVGPRSIPRPFACAHLVPSENLSSGR